MYKRKSGSAGSRGHCVAFDQNISSFSEEILALPRAPNELPIIVLESPNANGLCKFTAFQNVKIKVFPELAGTFK